MSSVDAPYVASTGASQPIVVKTFEVNAGGQARKRSSLKADDSSLSPTEPVVPSGEIVDPTSLDTTEHLVPESKDALPAEQYVPQVAPSDDALLHSSVTAPAPGTSSQIPTPTSSKQQPETSRVGEPSAKSAVSRNSETEKIEKEAEPEPEQKTEDDKVKKIPTD